jgi:hypothetical protein
MTLAPRDEDDLLARSAAGVPWAGQDGKTQGQDHYGEHKTRRETTSHEDLLNFPIQCPTDGFGRELRQSSYQKFHETSKTRTICYDCFWFPGSFSPLFESGGTEHEAVSLQMRSCGIDYGTSAGLDVHRGSRRKLARLGES